MGALEASGTWRPDRWPPGRCPMAGPGTREAMADPGTVAALADQGALETMVELGAAGLASFRSRETCRSVVRMDCANLHLPNLITINHKHNFQLVCFLHTGVLTICATRSDCATSH